MQLFHLKELHQAALHVMFNKHYTTGKWIKSSTALSSQLATKKRATMKTFC